MCAGEARFTGWRTSQCRAEAPVGRCIASTSAVHPHPDLTLGAAHERVLRALQRHSVSRSNSVLSPSPSNFSSPERTDRQAAKDGERNERLWSSQQTLLDAAQHPMNDEEALAAHITNIIMSSLGEEQEAGLFEEEEGPEEENVMWAAGDAEEVQQRLWVMLALIPPP